jgi:hypothetical protein
MYSRLMTSIGVFFPQEWNFFAPDPITFNFFILIKPLHTKKDFEDALKGRVSGDRWYNITSPCWDAFHSNRFSAYDRLARTQINSILPLLNGDKSSAPWREACKNGDKDACKVAADNAKEIAKKSERQLKFIASSVCKDMGFSGDAGVILRVRRTDSLPWPERYIGKAKSVDADLGVFPIDLTVESSGLYQKQ